MRPMEHKPLQAPIKDAVRTVGGQAVLARLLGLTAPTVNQWVNGVRPVPIYWCLPIEQATSGAVRRWDLRPDDWHRIWPELIGTEGAPGMPKEVANG